MFSQRNALENLNMNNSKRMLNILNENEKPSRLRVKENGGDSQFPTFVLTGHHDTMTYQETARTTAADVLRVKT